MAKTGRPRLPDEERRRRHCEREKLRQRRKRASAPSTESLMIFINAVREVINLDPIPYSAHI